MPTTAAPVLMPTPTRSGMYSPLPGGGGLRRALRVQVGQRLVQGERRLAGVRPMIGVVDRRIPERHDVVAHVLVDRAVPVEYGARQRREQPVDQGSQALGVRLVLLRDRREPAHVAEQHRHVPGFPAQLELARLPDQTFDQSGREVLGEGAAEPASLGLFAEVGPEHQQAEYEADGDDRPGRVEQHAVPGEQEPRPSGEDAGGHDAGDQGRQRAERRHQERHQQPGERRGQDFRRQRPSRTVEVVLRQDHVEKLRVDLHARHQAVEGSRPDVEQARGRRADQHDAIPQLVGPCRAGEDVVDRVGAQGVARSVVDPHAAQPVGRDDEGPVPATRRCRERSWPGCRSISGRGRPAAARATAPGESRLPRAWPRGRGVRCRPARTAG